MSKVSLGHFSLNLSDSQCFGEISGDVNPLHVNPTVARRYQFGSTVIHGVSGTLKALELYAKYRNDHWHIEHINVQYNKPIRQNEDVEVFLTEGLKTKIEVYCGGKRCQLIKLVANTCHMLPPKPTSVFEATGECQHLAFEQAISLTEIVKIDCSAEKTKAFFPELSQSIPIQQIYFLMALTKIVGMRCPGVNSVFGGFDISFSTHMDDFPLSLPFEVSAVDERFSKVNIDVSHPAAQGSIEAFFRAEPIIQTRYHDVKAMVPSDLFMGKKTLVIGGSRGIGEVAAKIVAAGGGNVLVGYAKGQQEAKAVVDEITSHGGSAQTIAIDILSLSSTLLDQTTDITDIFYFASPLIEKSDAKVFNSDLFDRFCQFYLHGLSSLIDVFLGDRTIKKRGLNIFIPSTTFLDEQPEGFTEYIAAKGAVEVFAKAFAAKHPSWHIDMPRLPRLPTDQTAAVAQEDPKDTVKLLVRLLNKSAGKVENE